MFQQIWTKYDPKASGFIRINDLPNLIMDLLVEEFKESEKNVVTGTCCRRKVQIKDDEAEVVLFGLHKERTANVYTKWKVIEYEHPVDENTRELVMSAV